MRRTFHLGLHLLLMLCFAVSVAAQDKPAAAKKDDKHQPIKAMLITGGCCHDYQKQKKILTEGISARTNLKIEWTIVHQGGSTTNTKIPIYENDDWAKGYDIVVHNECFAAIDDKEWIERVLKPHREGVNAMVIHCAMHTFQKFKDNGYRDFLGVTSHRHGPHHSFKVENLATDDPIMKGFGKTWTTPKGELYYVDNIGSRATPLARAFSSGGRKQQEVCIWKNTYGKARVFGTTIGHHNETMSTSRYLDFLTRGFLWSVGRLSEENVRKVPVKKVPINLALNKAATSSANQQGHLPRGATDGSLDTRYCAPDNGAGYWFQVDIGKPQEVTGVQVHWEQEGRLYRFKLEGSKDGKAWKLLHDGSKNESREQVQTYQFNHKDLRYFKMTCTEADPGAWYSFWEFRVLGTEMVEVAENAPGTDGGPLNDPKRLLAEMKIPEGFEAKIFAAPPQANYPVCITSTYDGVVYVGVDKNGSLDRKEGRGSVVRCKDTDGDGIADEFKTFCKVDSPRGLVWDRNKLYVLHPPDLSVYYDDDGDGEADRKETLVKGIGFGLDFRGADHTTNGIRMGIDGWIYVAVGDYGFIKATAKDGKTMQFKGGGVVRVRPDGTDLEVYAKGLRNICDIAIDPLMNIFTRDNTNDGGGWDIRLSHIIQSANYGYPSLYKHFNNEIMPPLADYGGGSGTGALYVANAALPKKYRKALFTCDWGRNKIFYHPLTQDGSTYSAKQEDFITLPRPTDMDIDAAGRIYVASWRRGQFKYQGENIGFVAVLSPQGVKLTEPVDVSKLSEPELLKTLQAPSDALRWEVVREIKSRNKPAAFRSGLISLVNQSKSLEIQVAAIAAGDSQLAATLLEQNIKTRNWDLVAQLIRFAVDSKKVSDSTLRIILDSLDVGTDQVRMAALIALGRLQDTRTIEAVLDFGHGLVIDRELDKGVKTPVNTSTKALRHVAVQTLAQIGDAKELLKHASKSSAHKTLALDAIKYIHSAESVSGLIEITKAEPANQQAWESLIRLYHTEGPYTGDWWGTRPDTTGPYYKRVKWDLSDSVGSHLEQSFAGLDPGTQKFVATQLEKHRIKLPGILAMAKKNQPKAGGKSMIVKVPEFDKNNPNQLGNIQYEAIISQLAKTRGNVKRGAKLFEQQSCAACHTIDKSQKAVGPQLVDIGQRYKKNELLESILKPSAKIAQGFTTQLIATDDGLSHTGFVTREAGNEVEIRTAEGKVVIIKKETIEARKDSKNSVMPEGLVNNLTVKDLASLIAYLQSLKSKP